MRTRFADFDRLARDGGTPVRKQPFAQWPVFDNEMLQAVQDVLKSGQVNYWTGQECREFENEFAKFAGCSHAIAVSNGTVALELALVALGIEAGDEVIVPPRTFVATASAVAIRGAVPVFADLDPVSGNISAETIQAAISDKTRAIIVVHAAGWPCDMEPIMKLARERGLFVIEDCAQAHGATCDNRMVGSIGDIGAFSFCQDKIMTTAGEGGMLTMNSHELWERAWSFKDHGKSWDAVYRRQHETVFRFLHESIGTNWRMTEVQGTIGRLALKKLPQWIAARRRNAAVLDAGLGAIAGLEVVRPKAGLGHSYYKYYVNVSRDALTDRWTRDDIVRALQAEGIPCGSGICCEIYREKAIESAGLAPADPLPVAADLDRRTIMFLVHPTLSEDDMRDIVAACRKVMRAVAGSRVTTGGAAERNAA
jgi:dTDP-4-amino-4,6-dideoxygalactose transaminase